MERFSKKVQKYGNSRVVLVPEFEEGQKVYVLTQKELDMLRGKD